jgi:hypothetical protein
MNTKAVSKSQKTLRSLAALGLVFWGATVANADNVLFNGNLDQIGLTTQANPCPIGWIVDSEKAISGPFSDGGDSEPWCNVIDPAGGYGFFFKPFQGNQPSGDLLSVFLYQDVPSTPGTKFTLSGYASGEANFCGFFPTNVPAARALFVIEFLDSGSNLIASNAFDLVAAGMPNGGPGSMSSFPYTTAQVTAPAGTASCRAGATLLNAYSTTGAQSFFVDGFDLESVAPAGSPVITNQPQGTTVSPGGTATISVSVSNSVGVTYQWQKDNGNLTDGGNIAGSSTRTLTVSSASVADVAHYRVVVANAAGTVYSSAAPLALQSLHFYPVVELTGKLGDTYRVDYSTAINPTTWIPLSTNKLTSSPQLFIDPGSPGSNTRFYRSVFLN